MTNEQKPVPATPDASKQVSGPSVGLLVTGIIGAFFSFLGLILSFFGTGFFTIWRDKVGEKYFGKEDFVEGFFEGVAGVASSIVGILVAAFIIYAALKMKELNQWGLCVAASVLAMIPCISPCCILGLPIGIWCLVILMRPEVKEAFS
ncbi:MAG: hypothetical protein WBC02_12090 [Candidatus Aminicenantaceae bacterium]